MNWQDMERKVLSRLAPALAVSIRNAVPMCHGDLEEIRLRINRPIALIVSGTNILLEKCCSSSDMEKSLQLLCDYSLYSHVETIREGYICTADGIRVGICGRAVVESGKVTMVQNVSALCIRIPSRHPDAASDLAGILAERGYRDSVLVYSAPGKGKTTVLREIAASLADPPDPKRVAVVDTRYELGTGLENVCMLDLLSGYPRSIGMEIAMRTLAPEYIICDEVSSEGDRQALLDCAGSGICLCASVHAGSPEELYRTRIWQTAGHIFHWICGIDAEHRVRIQKAGKAGAFVH